jgi:hypothetical protein
LLKFNSVRRWNGPAMGDPTGESDKGGLRLVFDRRLLLQLRGSTITSDAGLLPYRKLDDALGLTDADADALADARTGKNGRHRLAGLLRQWVFGRLAGYEDVNDAERLCRDPAMRWFVGDRTIFGFAAPASQMGRFETKWLSRAENLAALADLPGQWIDKMPEFLEAEGAGYAIRLPANKVLLNRIAYLLKRPAGRPPYEVLRHFSYEAQSWQNLRRVVAKVELHPAELYPRVGFIVTNLARPAEHVVGFYNQRGTAEQWIKEGKGAIKWTRLSCRTFAANAVRLELHALAYNLQLHAHAGDAEDGAAVVTDQPAGEADQDWRQDRQPRALRHVADGRDCGVAADVRRHPVVDRPATDVARPCMRARRHQTRQATTAEMRLDTAKSARFSGPVASTHRFAASERATSTIYQRSWLKNAGIWRMSVTAAQNSSPARFTSSCSSC